MSTSEHPEAASSDAKGFPTWLALAILLLPVFYVLSTGPAVAYYRGTPRKPPTALVAFYRPLEVLARDFRPLDTFIRWYIDLWLPKPQPMATTRFDR